MSQSAIANENKSSFKVPEVVFHSICVVLGICCGIFAIYEDIQKGRADFNNVVWYLRMAGYFALVTFGAGVAVYQISCYLIGLFYVLLYILTFAFWLVIHALVFVARIISKPLHGITHNFDEFATASNAETLQKVKQNFK